MPGFKDFTSTTLTQADVDSYLMAQAVIQCTSSTRPSSPHEGMLIYETDTDRYASYSGSAWSYNDGVGGWHTYTPEVRGYSGTTWVESPSYGNMVRTGVFRYIGARTVVFWTSFTVGSTSSFSNSTNQLGVTLPVSGKYRGDSDSLCFGELYRAGTAVRYPLTCSDQSADAVFLWLGDSAGTYVAKSSLTGAKFQLVNGDVLKVSGIYETAA